MMTGNYVFTWPDNVSLLARYAFNLQLSEDGIWNMLEHNKELLEWIGIQQRLYQW